MWWKFKNFFKRWWRQIVGVEVHYRTAFIQLVFYLILLLFDIGMRIFEKNVTMSTSIFFIFKTYSALTIIMLIFRLTTMAFGVFQIIIGIRDKENWSIIAGAASLLQSIPYLLIPTIAAFVSVFFNIAILMMRNRN